MATAPKPAVDLSALVKGLQALVADGASTPLESLNATEITALRKTVTSLSGQLEIESMKREGELTALGRIIEAFEDIEVALEDISSALGRQKKSAGVKKAAPRRRTTRRY